MIIRRNKSKPDKVVRWCIIVSCTWKILKEVIDVFR